jgi:hypothetical protein
MGHFSVAIYAFNMEEFQLLSSPLFYFRLSRERHVKESA